MALDVFLIVLIAALFHATWNAFVKVDGDRLLFMAVLLAGGGIAALAAALVLPMPNPESWPYIALSVLLHQGYNAFLLLAYRHGDLSHVYPLARGSAPLIVAAVSVGIIGEALSGTGLVAVVLMGLGIMSLAFARGAQQLRNPVAAAFALATGVFIAAYTLTDGIGARLSGSAAAYAAWLLGLEWIPLVLYAAVTRRRKGLAHVRRIWKPAVLMGLLSVAAYAAAIWAMTVAPIALVAALRETSIIFALLFGVVMLKEPVNLVRVAATFATLGGAVLIRLARH